MDIYFIRHGQSETNLNHVYSGWSQTPLSEKGFEDARRAGEILQKIPFEKIYASDLKRTVQTCETALPGCAYETDPLLRELSVGELSDIPHAQAQELFGEKHARAARLDDFTAFGGENRAMELERTQAFLDKLKARHAEGNIAVFCHYGTICCVLQLMLGFDFPYTSTYIDNCGICVFRLEEGKMSLRKWNLP